MFKFGIRAIYQKNIKAAILEAKRHGFDVLEIHLSSPQFLLNQYSKKELLALRRLATRQKIILQIHSSLESSLLFIEPLLRQAAIRYFEKIILFSRVIGARCLTIHPGLVSGYHASEGNKIKNDDIYRKYYSNLFDDSLKSLAYLAKKELFICLENTDNFNSDYQRILEKHLRQGKLFLTWDIRKNFSIEDNSLKTDQWNFLKRNLKYVRNIHISGLRGRHSKIESQEKRLNRFIKLFSKKYIPIVIEVLPLSAALESKNNLRKILCLS